MERGCNLSGWVDQQKINWIFICILDFLLLYCYLVPSRRVCPRIVVREWECFSHLPAGVRAGELRQQCRGAKVLDPGSTEGQFYKIIVKIAQNAGKSIWPDLDTKNTRFCYFNLKYLKELNLVDKFKRFSKKIVSMEMNKDKDSFMFCFSDARFGN